MTITLKQCIYKFHVINFYLYIFCSLMNSVTEAFICVCLSICLCVRVFHRQAAIMTYIVFLLTDALSQAPAPHFWGPNFASPPLPPLSVMWVCKYIFYKIFWPLKASFSGRPAIIALIEISKSFYSIVF